MKSIWYKLLPLIAGFGFQACTGSAVYDQKAKSLDSLNGALSAVMISLEKADTVLLQEAIERYGDYKSFIENNFSDTLEKNQADVIHQFLNSGNNLGKYKMNRIELLNLGKTTNSQLDKLSQDIKNRKVSFENMNTFVSKETKQGQLLIETIGKQQAKYFSNLEVFKISLKNVEQLIREFNKGELPTIVHEEQTL